MAQPPVQTLFDRFPEFVESTSAVLPRLRARHDCLIERHLGDIDGKTIVDIGAHNGRWAFAALMAGARKVVCIEPRENLCQIGCNLFQGHGIAPERYEWLSGDGYTVLSGRKTDCDTAFLFGVFYHVDNHVALARQIERTGAATVIIDTGINGLADNAVTFGTESNESILNSPFPLTDGAGRSVVGMPSREFVKFVFQELGFEVEEVDWSVYLKKWGTDGLHDYERGRRSTFVARRSPTGR
jgi:Protein of unknown function (DUF1698)